MCIRHSGLCVLIIVLLQIEFALTVRIGCKDEKNKDVDWFINYKLPERLKKGENVSNGTAYVYNLAPGSNKWTLSTKSVVSGSMLEATLNTYYDNKENLTYVFYNDDDPEEETKNTPGHLKGVLAFDGETGFWLVHSIPNFPDRNEYIFPEAAQKFGQTVLCVTFNTSELNEIVHQLLYSHPNIYDYELSKDGEAVLDDISETLFSRKPKFTRKVPIVRVANLISRDGMNFTSFAKDKEMDEDLYSDIIAPILKTSLVVETFRGGSRNHRRKDCNTDYTVVDVKSIDMDIDEKRNVKFKSRVDQSKWAISDEIGSNFVCIADLNRVPSEKRKGGGALCFESIDVKKAFDSIIANAFRCPEPYSKIV